MVLCKKKNDQCSKCHRFTVTILYTESSGGQVLFGVVRHCFLRCENSKLFCSQQKHVFSYDTIENKGIRPQPEIVNIPTDTVLLNQPSVVHWCSRRLLNMTMLLIFLRVFSKNDQIRESSVKRFWRVNRKARGKRHRTLQSQCHVPWE